MRETALDDETAFRHKTAFDHMKPDRADDVAEAVAAVAASAVAATDSAVADSVADSAVKPGVRAEDDFHEFVTARWSALLRTAYLLTGDRGRGEDLVQGALVRAHRHWSKLKREGGAEAYVRKIMVNLNTDWWRRLGSREHAVESVPDAQTAADAFAAFELHDELWTALRKLPARMRAVLVLRYFEDLSEAETAAILGCSTGTVKSQCSRGLGRLRLALESVK